MKISIKVFFYLCVRALLPVVERILVAITSSSTLVNTEGVLLGYHTHYMNLAINYKLQRSVKSASHTQSYFSLFGMCLLRDKPENEI